MPDTEAMVGLYQGQSAESLANCAVDCDVKLLSL
jgi:hypothetical protein